MRALIGSLMTGMVIGAIWVILTPAVASAQTEARFEISAVVNNGSASASDVTVSLRDQGGATIVAAPGSVSRVVPGDSSYSIGFTQLPGYQATTSCLGSDGSAQYPSGGVVNAPAGVTINCTVSLTLEPQAAAGPVSVTVSSNVVNDDGGSASSGSFVVELYNGSGSRIASNGGSLSTTVSRGGTYTVGVIGQSGYTTSGVSCSIERLSASFDEALTGFGGSSFTADASTASVSCVVTSNDVAAPEPTAVPATPVPTAIPATAVPAASPTPPSSLAFVDPTATPVRVAATATPRPTIAAATATPRPTVASATATPRPTVASATATPRPTVASASARPTATVRPAATATTVPTQRSSADSVNGDPVPTLAFTGAEDGLLAAAGALLVLFGYGCLVVARRIE